MLLGYLFPDLRRRRPGSRRPTCTSCRRLPADDQVADRAAAVRDARRRHRRTRRRHEARRASSRSARSSTSRSSRRSRSSSGLLAVNIVKPGVGREPRRGDGRSRRRAREDEDDVRRRDRAHRAAELLRGRGGRTRCSRSSSSRSSSPSRCRRCRGRRRRSCSSFCESLSEVMFKFVGIVMKFAPFGIGAAIAVTVGKSGLGVLTNLGVLVLTLYGALIVFVALRAVADRAHRSRCRSGVSGRRRRSRGSSRSRRRLGGGAAARAAEHGAARRAAAHRVVRAADGLLVQPRRHHALSRAGVGVRRAGRGHRHADRRRRS